MAKSKGAAARAKGFSFERKVASDLRLIYDGPQWCEAYESLRGANKVQMRKTSRVRRGSQAQGAREADVVVDGVQWWFELQCANKTTPLKKLEQAERDIGETGCSMRAVSICKETNARSIVATMRSGDYVSLLGCYSLDTGGVPLGFPITIAYDDFLVLLKGERVD